MTVALIRTNRKKHTKSKPKCKQLIVRTTHKCVHITVYNCITEYSTEQF